MSIERLPDGFVPSPLAVALPGFVENGVTYQSHTFHIQTGKTGWRACGPDVSVVVRHGGGWEAMNVGDRMGTALLALIANGLNREAFFLCWDLFDRVRKERLDAADKTAREYREAFCEGRLRKRKIRGQAQAKVWIESRPAPLATVA